MPKDAIEFLRHIAEETAYIISVTSGLAEDIFLKDETLKRAIVRSLEIIGEASKKIPAEFRDNHPYIEWKSMAGMRDRLIHDYFGINYSIVWDVVKNKIPQLHQQIQQLINSAE